MEFVGKVVGDIGATISAGNVLVGERLGLYRALAQGPSDARGAGRPPPAPTSATSRSGCAARRPAATWSTTQHRATYSMTPEKAFALTDPDGPVFLPGAFELAIGSLKAEPHIEEAFRTGTGYGWHEHDAEVFTGCERFFRPGYLMSPAARVDPGARRACRRSSSAARTVADLGCGRGCSTRRHGEGVPGLHVRRLR